MFLNEKEKNKLYKNKNITNHQSKVKKNYSKNNNYFKKTSFSDNNIEERISLTEHTNILNEYEEELKFLGNKRKNGKIFENLNNKENPNNNSNIIICLDNKQLNQESKSNNKNNIDKNIKISELFKLYHYLFIKSGLDNNRPSRFIDYLANEINGNDNLISNKTNQKINFEEIKKMILKFPDKDENDSLIIHLINEYFHCNFNHSIMERIIERINKILINQDNNIFLKNSKNINNININNNFSYNTDSYDKNSKTKKDKFSHSNILAEKLNNNNYQSCLSLTNDPEYFKSIIYICNKYSKIINKKNIVDKSLIELLEINKDLLKSFKEENKEIANKIDMNYFYGLLKNKKLKKYNNKNLKCFRESFNNIILNSLDKNNFNKIGNLLINNKNEDINKLEISSNFPKNLTNKNISNFLILLLFIIEITIVNKSPNKLTENDLTLINPIFKYFKQFDYCTNKNMLIKKKHKIKKIKNIIKFKDKNKILIENSINSIEEQKIQEDNKNKNNNIIKIFLNNNDFSFNNEKKEINQKNEDNNILNESEKNTFTLSISYKHNNFEKNKNYNLINTIEDTNINMNKIKNREEEIIHKEILQNKNLKIVNDSKCKINSIQKKLLNELSLGNDIFKLNYNKLKRKKAKKYDNYEKNIEKDEEKKEEKSKEKKIIKSNEEITKINDEVNQINLNDSINVKLIEKKGSKFIIYDDEFSENKQNDSNEENFNDDFNKKIQITI